MVSFILQCLPIVIQDTVLSSNKVPLIPVSTVDEFNCYPRIQRESHRDFSLLSGGVVFKDQIRVCQVERSKRMYSYVSIGHLKSSHNH